LEFAYSVLYYPHLYILISTLKSHIFAPVNKRSAVLQLPPTTTATQNCTFPSGALPPIDGLLQPHDHDRHIVGRALLERQRHQMIRRRGLLGRILMTIVVHGLHSLAIGQHVPQAVARDNGAAPCMVVVIVLVLEWWQLQFAHVRMRNHVRLEQGITETARHGQDAAHATLKDKAARAFNARHFEGIVLETVVDRQALGRRYSRVCRGEHGTVLAAAAAGAVSIHDACIPHIGRGQDNFRRGLEYLCTQATRACVRTPK
jgi:hypothetical protein